MNEQWVVPIVVAIVTGFGASGLAALFMIPKQRQAIDANATYQLTQSVVLASQELENLRVKMREVTNELNQERLLRVAAEERLRAWVSQPPYPAPPGRHQGGDGT